MNKQHLISLITILFALSFVNAQKTAIPDANFENYLETHSANGALVPLGDETSMGDGIENNKLVLTDRIKDVVTLSVSNLNIANLKGIEGFESLSSLICNNNKLTTLNVSSNLNLKSLLCSLNLLSDLDIRSNDVLEILDCSGNQLTDLILQENDIATNPLLERLTCSNNQLKDLDVSKNQDLRAVTVTENQLSGLFDVSNNTKLESLFCASNQISALDLNSNTALKNIDVSNNLLTVLDLSSINTLLCPDPQSDPPVACQGDASINVSRNKLEDLNIANGFNSLITAFNSEDNPSLVCIQIDAGFEPVTIGDSAWIKDDWAYYGQGACSDIYTYVPDDEFEKALIGLTYDSGALDNFVLTATIKAITDLDVSGKMISDLTGIEDFSALINLNCSNNDLKSIDLTSNMELISVDCSSNILPSLDLSDNVKLKSLICSSQTPYVDDDEASNNYTFNRLKVSANTALITLNCSNNDLAELDISNNLFLETLDCSFNKIEALNMSNNNVLGSFLCHNNSLLTLNLNNGNNVGLNPFDADSNPSLTCIEVDNLPVPVNGWNKDANSNYSLDCGTYVPDDNFEAYLETHDVNGNMVDITDGTNMGDGVMNNFVPTNKIVTVIGLDISMKNIKELTGIQDFRDLTNLNCSTNALTRLDLSNNINLTTIDCSSNQIEALDFSSNTALISLLCDDNNLFTLSIQNGSNTNLMVFDAFKNNNLYCIQVDDDASIGADWEKDEIADYSQDCELGRFTTILDDNFEQALIDLGLDFGGLDDRVLTSNIEHLLILDISDKNIADLSGIQGFSSLKELDCSGNNLNELDVSSMINLEFLNCNSNNLSTDLNGLFNITGTDNLIKLLCASNSISNLDITPNKKLETLDCADNNLNGLDISLNDKLKILNCSNNNLTGLNISNNIILKELNCNSNQISNLTSYNTNNTTLKIMSCNNNALSDLEVDTCLGLTTLNCRSNSLEGLDLGFNTALEILDISNNAIRDIDLVNNDKLILLLGSQNQLTKLDLNTNILLEQLNFDNNQITELLVDSTLLIKYLSCNNNQLEDLDLIGNNNLIEISLSSNKLTTITLPNDISLLKTFNCNNNQLIGDIDLSTMGTAVCPEENPKNPQDFCPDTISINLSSNQLDFVNIQNGINTEISNFNTSNNPKLSCIQVDDVSSIGVSWLKDVVAEYSLDCRFGETYVPDNNFEQALIGLMLDSGPIDNYVETAVIEVLTDLDISGKAISDLTGIEDFAALQNLNCSNNTLNSVDISNNINLIEFNVSNNTFSELDFSNNSALTTIDCSSNNLSNLDLVANKNLTNLNIANNMFSEFTPSLIPSLEVFICDSNQLLELDIQSNMALTSLSCQSNLLEKLNLKNGQNSNLTNFNSQNNTSLTCIETDTGSVPVGVTWLKDVTAEYVIDCYYGQTYVPDDNFEQALITLGYDNLIDDYVVTANIENISFLDISNKEILDLTGIEAFISLKNLNFESNMLSNIDLSGNVLLENINASNNILDTIDLSFAKNLAVINISNNNLSLLDLDSNLNITDLNVSINNLTAINVDPLTNLEKLDCSLNQLDNLSVTLNSNLKELDCQFNLFIQDKLNIQNGVNQNLEKFNAKNNPDLICILVDDPFKVISNEDGNYSNWLKDTSANYQTICDDADNDGVPNADDTCPGTPFGQTVNLFGCPFLSLPNNNFTILITGETCLNNNNGKINITTVAYFNYTATLTGDDFNKSYNFTNDIDILNLLAGTYQMCITVEEWPDYKSCYNIVISQPEPLMVSTGKSDDGKKVSIEMFGSTSYNIDFNGLAFTTSDSNITLNLQQGINTIKVGTDADCQGIHQEKILLSDKMFVYPNPFQDKINMYIGVNDTEKVIVNMYSYLGQLVYSKIVSDQKTNALSIDTSKLALGMYTISVQTNASLSTFKIVKK
ncbi:hypothetical protein GCM10023311_04740 [Flaviramulus aquimarinus]|uniref:Secretion system C-terminal sorting domain-containing protein n=1 Tax=Flaviramulus aquimarinus TaxID=1170456 RepID=A0ABP9ETJ4_9FLAO